MAAEIGLLSLTQLRKLSQQQQQQQQQPTFYNYTARRAHTSDEDDSWEVRAFVEDTTSAMGTTWPPRSYTCNFCRREFRSAQALGGHMNVHRRDRARLRQSPQELNSDHYHPSPSVANGGFQNYSGEFVANEGLCLFYPMSGRTGTSIEEVRTCEEGGVVEELDLELRLGWGF